MEEILIVTGVLVIRPSDEDEEDGITCDGVIQFRNPARGEVGKDSQGEGFAVRNPARGEVEKNSRSEFFAVRPSVGREKEQAADTFEIVTSPDEDETTATEESRE